MYTVAWPTFLRCTCKKYHALLTYLSWPCFVAHIQESRSYLTEHIHIDSSSITSMHHPAELFPCTVVPPNIHLTTWALLQTVTVTLAQGRLWTCKSLLCVKRVIYSSIYTERKIYVLNDVYRGWLLVSVWVCLGFPTRWSRKHGFGFSEQSEKTLLCFDIRWHTCEYYYVFAGPPAFTGHGFSLTYNPKKIPHEHI